ncbi:MAG: AMP-binding protein [Candidatus Gastranaerophilaceae bacterium]
MIVDFLKYFYTSDFDDTVILKNRNRDFTVRNVKPLISEKITFLKTVKEKKVILFAGDTFEFFLNFFACIFAGKEIFILNNEKSASSHEGFVFTTQCDTKDSGTVVPVKNCPSEPICSDDTEVFGAVDPDKILVNIFTSGSAGERKCVKKNLRCLICEATDLAAELDLKNSKTVISTTTCNYLFGLTFSLMLPLYSGIVVNTDRISYPENIFGENLLFITTPSFLAKLAKYNKSAPVVFEKIITAGSKLKESEFLYALNSALSVTEIYGSTESGVIAHRESPEENLKLFDNVEIIANDKIFVKTNYSLEKFHESGDGIFLFDNRKIAVTGRKDRILKINEKRVSAQELEKCLEEYPFVKEAYCTSIDGKISVFAALSPSGYQYVFENGIPALKRILKNFVAEHFEVTPKIFKFTDEIPKNERGKVDCDKVLQILNLNMSYPLICSRDVSNDFAVLKIFFYRNCNVFKGHFAGFPILPGVVQLLFAAMMIKDVFGRDCTVGQIRKVKFKRTITPNSAVELKIFRKNTGFEFKYYNNKSEECSSGILPSENVFEGEK